MLSSMTVMLSLPSPSQSRKLSFPFIKFLHANLQFLIRRPVTLGLIYILCCVCQLDNPPSMGQGGGDRRAEAECWSSFENWARRRRQRPPAAHRAMALRD